MVLNSHFYGYCELEQWIDVVLHSDLQVVCKGSTGYLNVPCSMDIETSSFLHHDEKCATMYICAFGINYIDIYCRTWIEYLTILDYVYKALHLSSNLRLVCYVHNLSYEWQFFKLLQQWEKVFAMSERRILYALTKQGIEYRCSYMLTGKSLAEVAKGLKYPIKKLLGNVDYTLIRHSNTKLNNLDLDYSKNDIDIVQILIGEKIEGGEDITKIPLTKTGYVRNLFKRECLYVEARQGRTKRLRNTNYRHLIRSLTIELLEFKSATEAFWGGFTHASCFHVGKVLKDCGGFDISSSYPSTMADYFPMSKGQFIPIYSEADYTNLTKYYYAISTFVLKDVEEKINIEHYISKSKCLNGSKNIKADNGRVVSANLIIITCTDIDFSIIRKFYDFEIIEIRNIWYYEKSYLPKEFVRTWLTCYANKTKLKGITEMEKEYALAKENTNSGYGMTVTNPLRDSYNFTGIEMEKVPCNLETGLEKYNLKSTRFLFYLWGVFITAIARKNLIEGMFLPFSGLDSEGNVVRNSDYIYSDTDSNKVTNPHQLMSYVDIYNNNYTKKVNKMLRYYNLPVELASPQDLNGKHHPLGHIEFEGEYRFFKTLGAKRYAYVDSNGHFHITVAGVPKRQGAQALIQRAVTSLPAHERTVENIHLKALELFNFGLEYNVDEINKLCLTYSDTKCSGRIKDFTGMEGEFEEMSYVHAEKIGFKIKESQEFEQYLLYLLGEKNIEEGSVLL